MIAFQPAAETVATQPQFAAGHPMSVYSARLQSGAAKASQMKVPDQSYSATFRRSVDQNGAAGNYRRSELDLRGTR
jgi:hypothetical protein